MKNRKSDTWAKVALSGCEFAVDAAWVVWLRSVRIMKCGEAGRKEACLMVSEKMEAHAKLAGKLIDGELGSAPLDMVGGSLAHYADYVKANRKRLAQKP